MANNKKPKKKYQPKGIIKDPIRYMLRGNKPAEESAITKLKIGYHMAMVAVTQGRAGKAEWQEIANVLNVAITLAEMGYGDQYLPEIVKAQGAMVLIRERLKATGRITVKAEEMNAINEALELHDQQVELVTVREMETAILSVERQLARGNFVTVRPNVTESAAA